MMVLGSRQFQSSKVRASPRNLAYFLICCRSFTMTTRVNALNIAVITGTTRTQGPPRPILGPRVASFITKSLEGRGNTCTVIDPTTFELLDKPQFAYASSQVPAHLKDVQQILEDADAYVCVTPEYNHAPAPGLLNVLNHFGSSTFSFKPSAIVSYSAGQWGGTRAAIALRPVLSELGCLPVSAMIHLPSAQEIFDEDGTPYENEEKWQTYTDRCFSQLEWWGTAAKKHKVESDPFDQSPSFRKDPSQRNAPYRSS